MSPDPDQERPTRDCPVCWSEFVPKRADNIYCCTRCKNTAGRRNYRRRLAANTPPRPTAAPTHPQPAAIRDCPHCGEPITIVALLTTPEAARPTTPSPEGVINLHQRRA